MTGVVRGWIMSALLLSLVGCSESASVPLEAGMGPDPELPPPKTTLIPTVNVAPAKGWPPGATPTPAEGLAVQSFAANLEHPRWLYVLPNGDVLVAETNAPPRPEEFTGIRGWAAKLVLKRAGALVPSANRITLLRDADGDGVAETRSVFLQGLNSPFGMALIGDAFYVANTDAILRFPYRRGTTRIKEAGAKVVDLPAGPLNHHWTKNIVASADGTRLYVTVGSNSNVGENGMDREAGRAAIHEVDLASGRMRPYATGLRNPNGLAWEPQTGVLWTTVNERDEIGSDLVPDYLASVQKGGFYMSGQFNFPTNKYDYLASVQKGGFYGWPYSYFGAHIDERAQPPRPDLVARAIVPDYALGAHTAALGLAFYEGKLLPARYRGGAFVGLHGSWNRRPLAGYKVVFVSFRDGRPVGFPQDVLSGFLDAAGNARGRPVGVAVDRAGALLVADDVGNRVWRVTPAR